MKSAAVDAAGRGEATARSVGHLDLAFPREVIAPARQIAHVRVGAIAGAAAHGHVAPVAELIDVVLHPPAAPSIGRQPGAYLGGDDLVGHASPGGDDRALEVAHHRLAHGVEHAIAAAHADARGVHEVAECVGLV